MCTYINFFPASRHIALTASVNIRKSSPKQLGMNKIVRTKSPTGSKFSKIFFEPLYTGWIVVVHLYCGFSLWCEMAPHITPNLEPLFLSISCQFEEGWRRQLCIDLDDVFDVCYGTGCFLQRTKHFAYPSVGGATRFGKLRSRFCKA